MRGIARTLNLSRWTREKTTPGEGAVIRVEANVLENDRGRALRWLSSVWPR
jgi:hypothetical protein